MATVSYNLGEMPPMTEERRATLMAIPDKEIDFSEIPEADELDFRYSIPGAIFNVLNSQERSDLGRRLLAAKNAEKARLAQEKSRSIARATAQFAAAPR